MLCFRCQKCVVKNVNLSSLTLKEVGGSVWESNPPTAGSLRPTGFEVIKATYNGGQPNIIYNP